MRFSLPRTCAFEVSDSLDEIEQFRHVRGTSDGRGEVSDFVTNEELQMEGSEPSPISTFPSADSVGRIQSAENCPQKCACR